MNRRNFLTLTTLALSSTVVPAAHDVSLPNIEPNDSNVANAWRKFFFDNEPKLAMILDFSSASYSDIFTRLSKDLLLYGTAGYITLTKPCDKSESEEVARYPIAIDPLQITIDNNFILRGESISCKDAGIIILRSTALITPYRGQLSDGSVGVDYSYNVKSENLYSYLLGIRNQVEKAMGSEVSDGKRNDRWIFDLEEVVKAFNPAKDK